MVERSRFITTRVVMLILSAGLLLVFFMEILS